MSLESLTPNVARNRGLPMLLRPEVHAWAMERPNLVAAGLRAGQVVVDLGCGDGTFARFLAAEVGSAGKVVAVDADEDMVDAAREADVGRGGVAIDWMAASAYETGLDDASVDLVFARHLFQHLTDPARALAEIDRILKPGGRVVLLDAHDGLLWLEPCPEGFQAFVDRAEAQQKMRGGDRTIGRRLGGMLAAAGFVDVRADVHVFDSTRLPLDLFLSLALGPVTDAFVGDDAAEADRMVDAARDRLAGDHAHGSAGFYVTWATKA